jgi:UDP-GlcNAc3NAcA epimerase
MTIATVIGARPQFVKAAVVSRAFHASGIQERIIHTGQHYDPNMSDVFFSELDIPKPQINLGIGGGSHGQNTGRMIESVERELLDHRPDALLVYGDTDSTLAGALAAVKLHVPVIHVEAGLRSFNRAMPEEINRLLTDHAADLLFAPTEVAMRHLSDEGIPTSRCVLVGDVMYDAALFYGRKAANESLILTRLGLEALGYGLATVHRAENTDDPEHLALVLEGLSQSPVPVVFPLHPRTRHRIQEHGLSIPENLHAIEPVGYLDMVMLEKNAAFVATDSGGVQKEAFFHSVPCLTLRQETEWTELVDAGWNHLVPPSRFSELGEIIGEAIGSSGRDIAPYGDGTAGEHIAHALLASL